MHHSAGFLRLFASAILGLAAAEPAHAAAQTECETKRRSCITECHARFFSIDPKRNACIANCTAEAARCAREQPAQQGAPTTSSLLHIRGRTASYNPGALDALTPTYAKTIQRSKGSE